MPNKKVLMNEAYDALLFTTGAVAISMVSKKLFKEPLVGAPNTVQGFLKLGGAVVGGTILVKYLQSKKYLPDEPFK